MGIQARLLLCLLAGLSTVMVLGGLGCAHGITARPPDGESIKWPNSVSPTRLIISGEVLQAVKAAADDFRPSGLVDRYELQRQKCLASQAAYDYEVVHDAQQGLYFVHVGRNDLCDTEALHMEADYAIDAQTWSVRERHMGHEVLMPQAPAYAALLISDCTGCEPLGKGFDYGFTAKPLDHTFYVRNIGERPAMEVAQDDELVEGFSYRGGTYPGTGGTCGSLVPAGGLCTVVVTFDPTKLASRADLGIGYHDGFTRRKAIYPISGIFADVAKVSISEWPVDEEAGRIDLGSYDYGMAGVTLTHIFHVRNTGAKAATGVRDQGGMGEGFNYKGGAYPGEGGTCGAALGSGKSCTLVVTFTPEGAGPRASVLKLEYHDGSSQQTALVSLRGAATTRATLSVQDFGRPGGCGDTCGPFEFGTVGVGGGSMHVFTVVNTGAAPATRISDAGGLLAPFEYAGGTFPGLGGTCGEKALAPGESCTVSVRFAPAAVGTRASGIVLAYDDAQGPVGRAQRTVRGTAR